MCVCGGGKSGVSERIWSWRPALGSKWGQNFRIKWDDSRKWIIQKRLLWGEDIRITTPRIRIPATYLPQWHLPSEELQNIFGAYAYAPHHNSRSGYKEITYGISRKCVLLWLVLKKQMHRKTNYTELERDRYNLLPELDYGYTLPLWSVSTNIISYLWDCSRWIMHLCFWFGTWVDK